MTWKRLAILGDSIAAGIREPHPGYRDLSWIDRIAEALPGPEVLNLARRGLRGRDWAVEFDDSEPSDAV